MTGISATLRLCPECKQAMVMVSGKSQSAITFWSDNGEPIATPHTEACALRGKALPQRPAYGFDLLRSAEYDGPDPVIDGGLDPRNQECERCYGTGEIEVEIDGGDNTRPEDCPKCEGSGVEQEATDEVCSCGNRYDGDNFCMRSACQWEV